MTFYIPRASQSQWIPIVIRVVTFKIPAQFEILRSTAEVKWFVIRAILLAQNISREIHFQNCTNGVTLV